MKAQLTRAYNAFKSIPEHLNTAYEYGKQGYNYALAGGEAVGRGAAKVQGFYGSGGFGGSYLSRGIQGLYRGGLDSIAAMRGEPNVGWGLTKDAFKSAGRDFKNFATGVRPDESLSRYRAAAARWGAVGGIGLGAWGISR
jgi:hypothetical protein